MVTLVSPGVDVQIIDESFYGGAGPGTVPLIVIATASNKNVPAGTAIAAGTVPANAGKLFLATSQRELVQQFGNPFFYSVQGTPLHGYELNEYGLHAAYSYLGVSNRAYVLRADLDLSELEASETAPVGDPIAGTFWFDLSETSFGVFQSNGGAVPGSAWVSKTIKLPTGSNLTSNVPVSGYGANGDFAIVTTTTSNILYEKVSGAWHRVNSTAWKAAKPTIVTGVAAPPNTVVGNVFSINGSNVTIGGSGTLTDVISAITTAAITNITATNSGGALRITNTAGLDIVLANVTGTPLTTLGLAVGTTKGVTLTFTNNASYPAGSVAGDVWIKGTSPNNGALWKIKVYDNATASWLLRTAPFYAFNSSLLDGNVSKDTAALTALGSPAVGTLYVGVDVATTVQEIRRWNGTNWATLTYEASLVAPSTAPEDGRLWYNADIKVDVMVGDGSVWQGYRRSLPNTDPAGVILSGSAPTTQTDDTVLVEGDLWIDTTDLENFPALYRWNATTLRWVAVDKTDQTTPFGIVFADARADSGPTFTGIPNDGDYDFGSVLTEDLLISDYVDPDAPSATAYPAGTLLFNTRYSTFNVKEYKPLYFKNGGFDPNTDFTVTTYTRGAYTFPVVSSTARWVTASGNRTDGAMWAGRKAQRQMVVRALAAAIQDNTDIRSEQIFFNLIAAPGYPELIDEMVTLNTDQKEIAFIVADTPARLAPNATAITSWATNALLATANGEDGLTTANNYVGLYYPWGLSSNVDGADVMIPPSTIALRTIAYNDSVSYQWFAPAGFARGIVTNAASVGYLTEESEYQAVYLNQGQRDVLYENNINPIAFIPNRGLTVYGQKTLSPTDSALDRINVARLANYLKYNLDNIVKPFLFEPNDEQTREAAKITVERFLTGLVGLRALDDYAVLVSEENNTAERIDRNELWIDVAVRPLKAIEFIYIPVRIRNTGDDLSFGS